MNLFRKRIEQAKRATNAKDPRDLAPVKRKTPGMMGAVRAALNARGAAVKRQGIRLAKRTAKPAPARPTTDPGEHEFR